MADDIRSRAGLDPREEAARRRREGEARRAAAREAMTDEEFRRRTMREMAERRAARNAAAPPAAAEGPARPINPRPNVARRMPAAAGAVARGAARAVPGFGTLRSFAPTSLAEGAEFERAGLEQARENQRMQQRAAAEQELAEAPQRMPTPRPARPRPAPAAAPREISADRLNDLMMGAEPATPEERIAQMRMMGRRQELEERGTAFKKGGMVKPPVKKKAGGMIAKPKKMKKGGAVAKPKGKPMPFKKGGKISMKGKK